MRQCDCGCGLPSPPGKWWVQGHNLKHTHRPNPQGKFFTKAHTPHPWRPRRPQLPRAPIRLQHSGEPTKGIQYSYYWKHWLITDAKGTRKLGEIAALRTLGYLPRPAARP